MSDDETRTRCILIPCSDRETWAVPQNCLAEILTLNADADTPPDEVNWRGVQLPVLDLGSGGPARWREPRGGTGLVAIFLGLKNEGCEYWGLAVRGEGLGVAELVPSDVVDAPGDAVEHATTAFRYMDRLYQVADLDGLQKKLSGSLQVA